MEDGKVSFVIRARNESDYIGFAIQSVVDHFGPKTQIVIVDNESTDETLDVISLFPKKFYNIDVIQLPHRNYSPGKALNLGIAATKTSIVGLLSAHCQIVKIPNLDFNDKTFGILGKQIPIYRGKKITPKYIWNNFQQKEIVENLLEDVPFKRYFFHNAFAFIQKSFWDQESFNEEMMGKEDRIWAEFWVERGFNFKLDPNLECNHFWTKNGATWLNMG